ncbi:MAG: hypothetical protein ABIW80_00105 [Lapillicoccus sp.]
MDEDAVAFVVAALTLPLGAAILIGLARPRIIDVRALLARSVVAGVVTTAYTAAFVGLWPLLDCLARVLRRRRRGTRGRCSAVLRSVRSSGGRVRRQRATRHGRGCRGGGTLTAADRRVLANLPL